MSGAQAPRRDRRPQHGRREAGQATPSVVAVVSVAAIVVALVAFFAGGDEAAVPERAREAAVADVPAESARTPAEPQRPSPTAARTPRREKPDTAERGKRADRRAKQAKQRRIRPEPDTGPPQVYIEVYNNTSISGLAASTAAELQDAGWQVVGVDNWYGDIPSSTVYHPDGLEDEADQLAEELGIERVRGAVAPMKFDRLTVILTGDTS
jgi:hypothetical protein